MIPDLQDNGYLPPGIHPATLDEIEARFGWQSEIRQAQMESLRWLIDLLRRTGALRIIINGSFTTDRVDPNDVDCVVLVGSDFPKDERAGYDIEIGLPFLQIDLVHELDFQFMVETFFAADRRFSSKGMIEVVSWN